MLAQIIIRLIIGVGLGCFLSGAAAAREDQLCSKLKAFERASFEQGAPSQRFVELHWLGSWMNFETGWGLACLSSPDPAAKELCDWLREATSIEFPEVLPRKILECNEYRFPPRHVSWANWRSDIYIDRPGGQVTVLQVDFFTIETETGAVRYTAFAPGSNDSKDLLPALKAMPRDEKPAAPH